MLAYRGFSAWIVSEGESIQEHLVAIDSKTHRVSCWIPCEPGKTFAIHWSDEGSKITSCAFITLDGFTVPGRFLFGEGSASREGVRSGGLTERPFVFGEHDDNARGKSSEPNREAGMIVLKVKRVRICGNRAANAVLSIPDSNQGRNHIAGVCVRYGEERKTFEQHSTTWKVKPYEEDDKRSYVTFTFRYRTRKFLEAQGIITESRSAQKAVEPKRRVAPVVSTLTPSPSPSPSPNPRKMESKLDRMSPSLRQAFIPGIPRPRSTAPNNYRTVAGGKTIERGDRFPGESLILFGNSPPSPS